MAVERGYFCIEARIEGTHGSPDFVEVDEIGGSLGDAKSTAQSYIDRHVAQNADRTIEWVEGSFKDAVCWYGRNRSITFRITR